MPPASSLMSYVRVPRGGTFTTHVGSALNDFVSRLSVTGLFGYIDHDIHFRLDERTTILTGINGSGKTHVLGVLRDFVALDLMKLARVPCKAVRLQYASGNWIQCDMVADADTIRLSGSTTARDFGEIILKIAPARLEEIVPPNIERLERDVWIDRLDGELLATTEVFRRYGRARSTQRVVDVLNVPLHSLGEWESAFRQDPPPTLVETHRLDMPSSDVTPSRVRPRAPSSRVKQYVDRIGAEIVVARRASLDVSQRADRRFASRALDRARATVQESELRRQYEELASLNEQFHLNGLTETSFGLAFPGGRTNPTERRILSVFLEDWKSKLSPLEHVNEKIMTFRSIVDEKLRRTGKALDFSEGELKFQNVITREPLLVERLSSGEQHLLALFSMLVFATDQGALVLIDEPELSLHAAWKEVFLADIGSVAALNDLQVVLATHSSSIVHGHWELTEELELPVTPLP